MGSIMRSISGQQSIGKMLATVAILLALVVAEARGEPLTVLLMPLEPPAPDRVPFTIESHPFSNLMFRNTPSEFQKLNVGYQRWICEILNGFGQRYSETVNVQFLSWETALVDIQAIWKSTDVFQVPSSWTASFISRNMLARVEQFNKEDYINGLLSTCSLESQDEVYAVPWIVDFRVLYFRPELAQSQDEFSTYEAFVKCLGQRRETVIENHVEGQWQAPFAVTLYRNWELMHGPIAYFFQGEILSKRRRRWQPAFHKGQAYKGLEKLWRLAQADLIHFVTREETDNPDYGHVLAVGLLEGKWDCILGWPAMRSYFEWQGSPIQAVPLPGLFGKKYQFIGGSHLGVSAVADQRGNELLARQLLQWLTSFETAVAMYRNTACLPANTVGFNRFIEDNPKWKIFGEIVSKGQPYPSIPQWAKNVEQELTLNNFYSLLHSIAAKEGLSKITEQVNLAARDMNDSMDTNRGVWAIVGLVLIGGITIIAIILLSRVPLLGTLRKILIQTKEVEKKEDKIFRILKKEEDTEVLAGRSVNVFQKTGDYWVIRFRGGDEHYIARSKGMAYIAQLLDQQNKYVSVLKLVQVEAKLTSEKPGLSLEETYTESNRNNRSVPLKNGNHHMDKEDFESLREYESKLNEMNRELEEAKRKKDEAKQDRLEKDKDAILKQIGSSRTRFASEEEKARTTVTHAIKGTLKKIKKFDKELGTHLQISIKTGKKCSYRPETNIKWQL